MRLMFRMFTQFHNFMEVLSLLIFMFYALSTWCYLTFLQWGKFSILIIKCFIRSRWQCTRIHPIFRLWQIGMGREGFILGVRLMITFGEDFPLGGLFNISDIWYPKLHYSWSYHCLVVLLEQRNSSSFKIQVQPF